MALSKTVHLVDSFGDTREFADAYIRGELISGDKQIVLAQVVIYRSAEDRRQLKSEGYRFAPSLTGENFIAQAYAHLKALPEFADAVDC